MKQTKFFIIAVTVIVSIFVFGYTYTKYGAGTR